MRPRRRDELAVGVLLLGALVVLGWMALRVGALSSFEDGVDVDLRLADAAGLQAGAVVSVAGVQVGKVLSLSVDHDRAVARLTLDPAAGLRRDVEARVRARSLLGEKYVALRPLSHDAALLVDGDVLATTAEQVEVDEVLGALGPVLAAVDPEAVGAAVGALVDAVRADPERPARMLADAEALLDRGAAAAEGLPALVARADATLDRLDAALLAADARLVEAKAPLARLDRVLAEAESAEVGAILTDARGAVVEVRGLTEDARGMLGELDGVERDLRAVLANFAEIDKWELRRLLREEGILVRIREREVVEP